MSIIYGTASDKTINRIQKIQNRALRSVFGIDFLENRVTMYAHLVQNCLPIRAINFVNTATYIYNNLNQKIHTNIAFDKYIISSRTRRAGELKKSESKTNYGQKNIRSLGVTIYNRIPQEIKFLPHMHAFKWALKCHIRNEEMMQMCFSGEYLKTFGG